MKKLVFTREGVTRLEEGDQRSVLTRLRHWLIVKLAGRSSVVINTTVHGATRGIELQISGPGPVVYGNRFQALPVAVIEPSASL